MIKIKPSQKNTNLHTEKGMQLLEQSIDKAGVLESISVATDGTIISGHARKEIFDKKGMVAKEIELKDNEFAVIKTKIEPNTKQYYEAQILANTTANKNFNLDTELIEEIVEEFDIDIEEAGVDIDIRIDKSEDGEEIHFEQSVQLEPPKEYILIMAEPNSEEWEEIKEKLKLKMVRRGGYKEGSSFDAISLERVLNWNDFKERYVNSDTK
jgi:hypothetical protein